MKKFFAVFVAMVVMTGAALWIGYDTKTDMAGQTGHGDPPGRVLKTKETETLPTSEEEDASAETEIESITANITAANACVLHVESDFVLYEKNSDAQIAPASTAKMLTALTVLEICSLDERFTVGPEIDLIASDSSTAWLNRGDRLTVKQLLVALLLPSGNDAAYTLAVHGGRKVAGDDRLGTEQAVTAFVAAMNKKAKEAGAASSHFVTPDGYDAEGQYTTASDLAQIAKACLRQDVLVEIMGSHKMSETWASGRAVTYINTNRLIDPGSQYYYARAIGLKTGHSGAAGSCLVSAAVIDEKTYICVVMGASADTRFSDSLTILGEIDGALDVPSSDVNPPDDPPVPPGGFGGGRGQA